MFNFFGPLRKFIAYLIAVCVACVAALVLLPFRGHVNITTVALVHLLVVLLIATLLGSRPALFTSLLAAFSFNFFFLPPYYTLSISEPQNWIAFFSFLVVAITVGELSSIARRRAADSERLYRELQEAFEKTSQAEAIKRSEKLKSALLDAVTHDLRTPLTSIKASVTMLIEENARDQIHITLQPQGRTELLNIINEETDRLNTFVESMVELARLEAGEINWRKSPTSVDEIIANALQNARRLTANHRVTVKVQEGLPPLNVEPQAIAEAVYNLVHNAAQYSPTGSGMTIEAGRVEGGIRFSIEDEGSGIAVEDREKVFRKFYRSDNSTKGFGMGLAIVRGIVEAHGGTVWIESGTLGSKFVFDLPCELHDGQ